MDRMVSAPDFNSLNHSQLTSRHPKPMVGGTCCIGLAYCSRAACKTTNAAEAARVIMTGVLVTLLSSFSWSLFDAARKRLSESLSAAAAVVWLMLLQTPLFAALSASEAWQMPSTKFWLPALIAIVLNSVAHVLFIRAVALAPFSLALPVLSLTPVFAALGGFLVLGEAISLRQGGGVLVILFATLAMPRSEASTEAGSRAAVTRGLMLMAAVAFLWALAPVVDKICLSYAPPSEHAFIQCIGIASLLAAWVKLSGRSLESQAAKKQWRWLAGAVVFAAAALFFQFWAIQKMPVGIFEALKRSFGLVAAITLGFLVFREKVTARKVAVAALMGVGIFLLLV